MNRTLLAALLIVALVAALALVPVAGQAAYQRGYTPNGWYWCARC